jgi:hypothetical protein
VALAVDVLPGSIIDGSGDVRLPPLHRTDTGANWVLVTPPSAQWAGSSWRTTSVNLSVGVCNGSLLAACDTPPRLQGSASMLPARIEVHERLPFSRSRIPDMLLYEYAEVGLKQRLISTNVVPRQRLISTKY